MDRKTYLFLSYKTYFLDTTFLFSLENKNNLDDSTKGTNKSSNLGACFGRMRCFYFLSTGTILSLTILEKMRASIVYTVRLWAELSMAFSIGKRSIYRLTYE